MTSGAQAGTVPRRVEIAIGGMHCAACAARLEKHLNQLPGVEAAVNFAAEKAYVRYQAGLVEPEGLLAAVAETGFTGNLSTAATRAEEQARK